MYSASVAGANIADSAMPEVTKPSTVFVDPGVLQRGRGQQRPLFDAERRIADGFFSGFSST
ncbi:MAG: hypothetical protein IPL00_19055 [Gammaproteobacteria bacterium]|nr:hypothetical protein [Gammaproteobacteria bacterium]